MKKIFVLGICFLVACAIMNAAPVSRDLNQGENLKMNLKLSFSEEAKEDGAFVSWELNGDWDEFDCKFSQGLVEGNIFTIKAADYKEFSNGEDGIVITITGRKKTEAATYNLLMKVTDVSDNLDFPKSKMNLDLRVNYILPPPTPIWKKLLMVGGIIAIVILIIIFVLKQSAKFPKGLLQIGRNDVYLKGKSRISVRDELEKVGVFLEGNSDVVFIRKRFKSFQGPCVKQMVDCSIECNGEFVLCGKVLLPAEELKGLKDVEGNDIVIRYC